MLSDSTDQPYDVAVAKLQQFGLSAYAARTFVALSTLGSATARDVSAVSDVPRTKVYDAVAELQQDGLVDVKHANPQRFRAVSGDTAGQYFETVLTDRVNQFREAVDALETHSRSAEQRGVWTVSGREHITDRVVEFLEAAEREVVFMSVADLLADRVLDSLQSAQKRGVSIRLGGMSAQATARIEHSVSGAQTVDSLWDWSDTPAGRLLMTDRQRTLVSVVGTSDDGHSQTQHDETAIWGSGTTNNLVVVLRAVFTWQLEDESNLSLE